MNGDSVDPGHRRRLRVRRPQLRRARSAARDGEGRRRRGHRARLGRRTPGQRPVPRAGLDPGRPPRQDLASTTRSAARRPSSTRSTTARSRSSPAPLGDTTTAATFTSARRELAQPASTPRPVTSPARRADGSFPPGPAFQRSPLPGIGQDGWEEGNSIQYTWSVPAGPARPVRRDGRQREGRRQARHVLHAPQHQPEAAVRLGRQRARARHPVGVRLRGRTVADAGRRAPHRDRSCTRRRPNGEPGNDDLGAMSSWYVWAAIGLYPETPGAADLVLASPAVLAREHRALGSAGPIEIDAPGASAVNRYVQSSHVDGMHAPAACGSASYVCPWLPASVLTTGARLAVTLAATPDRSWGAAPSAAPPSITRS